MKTRRTNSARNQQGKEVKNMNKVKMIMVIGLMIIGLSVLTTDLLAVGTPFGTILSNKTCEVTYSNISGDLYTNSSPLVTTFVTQGHDLSFFNLTSDITQYSTPGGVVEFFFEDVTNWGNYSDDIIIGTTTNGGAIGNWSTATLVVYTNGWGNTASSNANGTSNQISLNSGQSFGVIFKVYVPISVTDGDRGEFGIMIRNSCITDWSGSGGDSWPTPYASDFNIMPDTINDRDAQGFNLTIIIQGPVMDITKTVNTNSIRPFEVLSYTIRYSNMGFDTARGVEIIDYIPNNTVITQDSAEFGNVYHDGIATVGYVTNVGQPDAPDTFDNGTFSNRKNIMAVRWTLESNVDVGEWGELTFSVIVE